MLRILSKRENKPAFQHWCFSSCYCLAWFSKNNNILRRFNGILLNCLGTSRQLRVLQQVNVGCGQGRGSQIYSKKTHRIFFNHFCSLWRGFESSFPKTQFRIRSVTLQWSYWKRLKIVGDTSERFLQETNLYL